MIKTRHLLSCFLFYRLPIDASLVTMSTIFITHFCITCQPTKVALWWSADHWLFRVV